MKTSAIYLNWIKYLKKKGLYGAYMKDYISVNEYIYFRDIKVKRTHFQSFFEWHKEISRYDPRINLLMGSVDYIIPRKDDSLTFNDIQYGMEKIILMLRKPALKDWTKIATEFGKRNGYLKKIPEYCDAEDFEWDVVSSSSAIRAQVSQENRYQPDGQWYDRFYNRGRNMNNRYNNRYNIRWRR